MVDPTAWVAGMLRAIEDEIAERRKTDSVERLPVGDGERIAAEGDGYAYLFRRAGLKRATWIYGGELSVAGGGPPIPVRVEGWPELGAVLLGCDRDLGTRPRDAELIYQADGAWPALKNRLEESGEALERRILEFFGDPGGTARVQRSGDLPGHDAVPTSPDQAQAITAAMTHEVSRIWGPPGTGKTFTAAALARVAVQAGLRVILCGPTHRSVDLVLLRTLATLGWRPGEAGGRVVRLGEISPDLIDSGWGEELRLGEVHGRTVAAARSAEKAASSEAEQLRAEAKAVGCDRLRADLVARAEASTNEAHSYWAEALLTSADVLCRAQLVAATVHRTALGRVPKADVLIMDEAGMVSLPLGLLASLHARQVVLVGDPRQLGPVVQARSHAARRWLGTAIFDDPDPGRSELPPIGGPCVLLRDQRRMPPEVCALVSELSYDGRLRAGIAEASAPKLGGGDTPILPPLGFLHVPSPSPSTSQRRFENSHQARVIISVLADLIARCPALRGEVAVITPYRAHVRSLQAEADSVDLATAVEISTVHRFQGHEHPLVVFSLPERWGESLGWFLRAGSAGEDGGRLLTVALSRATRHLIVAGDLHWLRREAPGQGQLARLLALLKELGEPLDVHSTLGETEEGITRPMGSRSGHHIRPGNALRPDRRARPRGVMGSRPGT